MDLKLIVTIVVQLVWWAPLAAVFLTLLHVAILRMYVQAGQKVDLQRREKIRMPW